MAGTTSAQLPEHAFAAAAELEAWLEDHHADLSGIWLLLAKKGTGVPTVSYEEAVELGLCFGWIDGQTRRVDDVYYALRFTPRRPRSVWAQTNVERVARLETAGRMRPSGRAHVEAAKADGRWEAAAAGPATMAVPEDLQQILDGDAVLAERFAALAPSERYQLLYGLQTAVRSQTRARRLAKGLDQLRTAPTRNDSA